MSTDYVTTRLEEQARLLERRRLLLIDALHALRYPGTFSEAGRQDLIERIAANIAADAGGA
jgi:hypothetical protein